MRGHSCSRVVEHKKEVEGSNPYKYWAFSLPLTFPTFLYQWIVISHVPQGVLGKE